MVNCGFKHQLMVKRETLSSSTDGNWTINKWGVDKQNLLFYKEKGDYEPTRVGKIRLKNYKKQKGWGDHRFWVSMSDHTPVLCTAVTFGKDDQSWSWIPSKLVEKSSSCPGCTSCIRFSSSKVGDVLSLHPQPKRQDKRQDKPSKLQQMGKCQRLCLAGPSFGWSTIVLRKAMTCRWKWVNFWS